MIKILIISYLFAPNNSIGALRPTKIAKLLSEKDYYIDVVSAGYLGNDTLPFPEKIRCWYPMNKDAVQSNNLEGKNGTQHINISIPMPIRQFYRSYKARKKERQFYNYFTRLFDAELSNNQYDVVFTSFGPLVSLECGLYVKKHFKHIKWICDFRDPVITDITPFPYKMSWKWKEQYACRMADEIIAVSNKYVHRICGNKYPQKTHMIPNGYDKTDMSVFDSNSLLEDGIHITYVGSLYGGRRKITPLFRALRELADSGKIDISHFHFDYAGGDGASLCAQADEYNLSSIVCDHQMLSRVDCLRLQYSSHLLVLSTWNYKGEEGVFPGKFLEYLLIGHPIISLTTGNIPDGEVTSVMREGHFGVAYESIRDKEDMMYLKKYIESSYCEWKQKGVITYEPVQAVLERYNYINIISRIEELL